MTRGPNDRVPCPSDEHRRNAWAHGRICPVCEPTEAYPVQCPYCRRPALAAGSRVLKHEFGGRGFRTPVDVCPGSGGPVEPPAEQMGGAA